MTYARPNLAPICWGSKYQDGDQECRQCPHNDTCRPEMLSRLTSPPPQKTSLPVLPSIPSLPTPFPSTNAPPQQSGGLVHVSQRPWLMTNQPPAPPSSYPAPNYRTPSAPPPPPIPSLPASSFFQPPPVAPQAQVPVAQPSFQQWQQYRQQQEQPQTTQYPYHAAIPDPKQPNPFAAWHRPGVVNSPSYYFSQYPGESVGGRIFKNMVLRGLAAVFQELTQFFTHWTWPPVY